MPLSDDDRGWRTGLRPRCPSQNPAQTALGRFTNPAQKLWPFEWRLGAGAKPGGGTPQGDPDGYQWADWQAGGGQKNRPRVR